jgi:hypothetical protein
MRSSNIRTQLMSTPIRLNSDISMLRRPLTKNRPTTAISNAAARPRSFRHPLDGCKVPYPINRHSDDHQSSKTDEPTESDDDDTERDLTVADERQNREDGQDQEQMIEEERIQPVEDHCAGNIDGQKSAAPQTPGAKNIAAKERYECLTEEHAFDAKSQ